MSDCGSAISDFRRRSGNLKSEIDHRKSGSALIVALWVLIVLALLISSFAFDMQIESGITSYYRKRIAAQYLARAGVEYARLLLVKSFKVKADAPEEEGEDEDLYEGALDAQASLQFSVTRQLGRGSFTVTGAPESGRENINYLAQNAKTDDEVRGQLTEMLDQSDVPEEIQDELIDCLIDWVDGPEGTMLLGAESDDSFYEDAGYECKNAPLDSVQELVLIKGWTPSIVFGGPYEKDDEIQLQGIAHKLTVWGGGLVNINSADADVLLDLPALYKDEVDRLLEERARRREEKADQRGFESADEVCSFLGLSGPECEALKKRITTTDRQYVRVESIGQVEDLRSGVWAVFRADEKDCVPVFWREEDMP